MAKTYAHSYLLSKQSSGSYTVRSSDFGSYTIKDTPDNASDNLYVLGDLSRDVFSATSTTSGQVNSDQYIGRSNTGIVSRYIDPGGNLGSYTFYTNAAYSNGQAVSGFIADSPGNKATYTAVCFCLGTRIRTTRGDVAVEDLRAGDRAVTASGAARPIRWIGHRTMDPRRQAQSAQAMPIRIRAHAFGENRPARDLRVSPGHSVAVDVLGQVLVPAFALVNGSTIVQEAVDSVTYWHVELDSHDVILAENLPAESYLDMGNREFFAESGVVDLDALPDRYVASRRPGPVSGVGDGRGTQAETATRAA